MFDFHYDVSGKLREIFKQHCNLSLEQYEEITIQLVDLVEMIRFENPEADINEQIYRLSVIFDFLLSTKELTLQEHYKLKVMAGNILRTAEAAKAELARAERAKRNENIVSIVGRSREDRRGNGIHGMV